MAPLQLPLLRSLIDPARPYLADFLAPPPGGPDDPFEVELGQMLRTPRAQVVRELRRAGHRISAAEVGDTMHRLERELRLLWHEGLLPDWPDVRAVLERDIAFRARQLARDGGESVLAGLHPAVTAGGSWVRIKSGKTAARTSGGRGLVLVPSVFAWPDVFVIDGAPWRPTVAYPARGVVSAPTPRAGEVALGALAGKARARVLLSCREGTTTSEIARTIGLTAGAVSQHVGRLRTAGLVHSLRSGRFVSHELTATGRAVVAAFGE
jgi:DNA-binding transcriptional ArsR family regulator